jgi:C4-type Zn-finger protein
MSNDIQPDRELIKNAVGFIAGISVAAVVREALKNNVEKSGFGYITIPIGMLVIGGMASKAAKEHTDGKLDRIFEALERAEIITRVEVEEPTE